MLEIFGKEYYIDVDEIIEKCRPTYPTKAEIKEDPSESSEPKEGGLELNIFKFEVFKACVERTLGEYDNEDEKLGAFAEGDKSVSFKIAFNTLLKNDILIENNE
jgi:hypothetical protein